MSRPSIPGRALFWDLLHHSYSRTQVAEWSGNDRIDGTERIVLSRDTAALNKTPLLYGAGDLCASDLYRCPVLGEIADEKSKSQGLKSFE